MENQLILALKNNKLLKNIDLSKVNLEDVKGDLLTIQEGEIIYREGHPSDAVYLVVSGEINLLKKKLLGKTKSLVYYDNEFFGNEEFVEGTSRTSTTVALRDSYVIKLSKTEIDKLCGQENNILENLKDPSKTEPALEQTETEETKSEPEISDTAIDESTEDFNLNEEDFKIPEEMQSTIDSAIAGLDENDINNVEEEIESNINSAIEENNSQESAEEFSLDEQAFADSLKDTDDDIFFNIDELDSDDDLQNDEAESLDKEENLNIPEPENTEEGEEILNTKAEQFETDTPLEIPEPEIIEETEEKIESSADDSDLDPVTDPNESEINTGNEEEPQDMEEENNFAAQPYQPEEPFQPSQIEEQSEDETADDAVLENDFNFEDNYSSGMSKEDEEFFKNVSADEEEINEQPEPDLSEENAFQPSDNDLILPDDFESTDEETAGDDVSEEVKTPDFEDFPPGLLDDDGIPKPEGEIPDDFNFDHETVEPIEPETDDNMFDDIAALEDHHEENTNQPKEEIENSFAAGNESEQIEEQKPVDEFTTEESIGELNEEEDKVTYSIEENEINILEGSLNEDSGNIEENKIEENSVENYDEEFLSDEEKEAEENLKNIENEKENTNASSAEDGHMTADQLMMINKAAQLVNSNIKLDDVLTNIVDVATNLTSADRGTLYLVDNEKGELWSKVAMGNELKQIRLNLGEGIAGWVGQSGEIVNIEDVSADSRFKSDYDKSSGYQTKTMLCFPIKNKEEEIVGVVQLLNSKNGKFSVLDETFLNALSIHAALALENASLVEKLLQTERVSSLGKMANFLIQDIKKPVLVSKRYAEHLRSKEFPEDIYQVIDMLMEQLNHVADIVQTTSSYSQGTSVLRTVNTSLNQLLDDYCGRIESLVTTRNCSIMKEYGDDVKVKVDIKEFNQCFSHIIKNACDAMPEGGTVKLSTRKEDGNVKISIKDFGLGIPDTMKEKIFEPFMSHGKKEGTGLGLSITKKLIEDHGGSIEVISELGEGADFIITLPVASEF